MSESVQSVQQAKSTSTLCVIRPSCSARTCNAMSRCDAEPCDYVTMIIIIIVNNNHYHRDHRRRHRLLLL